MSFQFIFELPQSFFVMTSANRPSRLQLARDKPLVLSLDEERQRDQSQSPLFAVLPPEIRNLVFHYALLSYEDSSKRYDLHKCFVRPGYTCRRKTHTALLQTCQRIYREAWFRPWTSAEHTLFFTAASRRPRSAVTIDQLTAKVASLARAGIEPEIDHLRIFPQLCALEPGYHLKRVLKIPQFHPKTVTICLRHTDWWHWEHDEPLRIDADWVNKCNFPDSVTCIRMELETLCRKKAQMDDIAAQMRALWRFRRMDGTLLTATEPPSTEYWTGYSVLCDYRWIRDEARPMELDYYVLTVKWRPALGCNTETDRRGHAPNLVQRLNVTPIYGQKIPWPTILTEEDEQEEEGGYGNDEEDDDEGYDDEEYDEDDDEDDDEEDEEDLNSAGDTWQ